MMKQLLVFCAVVLVVVAVPFNTVQYRQDEFGEEDRESMWFPDGDGNLHLINLVRGNEHDDSSLMKFEPEKQLHFQLFTQRNPSTAQIVGLDEASLRASNFNPANPTRFVAPGWNSAPDSFKDMRNAYLSRGDMNVFLIDWTAGSNTINYIAAADNVQPSGQHLARFIDHLVALTGIKTSSIHLAGHSLGAHLVGVAGRLVKSGNIHTVTGLDPALPLFSINAKDKRISETSGEHVEIIHTCGGLLGFSQPLGTADFYPNGGRAQPGCGLDLVGSCAHGRSHEFFTESITSNRGFWSFNCQSFEQVEKGKCVPINDMRPMGVLDGIESNHGLAFGIYYLATNTKYEFAQGLLANRNEVIEFTV